MKAYNFCNISFFALPYLVRNSMTLLVRTRILLLMDTVSIQIWNQHLSVSSNIPPEQQISCQDYLFFREVAVQLDNDSVGKSSANHTRPRNVSRKGLSNTIPQGEQTLRGQIISYTSKLLRRTVNNFSYSTL